jgi:small GTP-binding protein
MVQKTKTKADDFDHTIKLLVLGDSAVGKSSLLMRFCESKFDSNFVITIGVDFKSKIVQRHGQRIRLQIWDTAGQERFRTITPAYYKAGQGVLLVYDITDEKTFENVKYWLQNLEEYNTDAKKILVGNKVDRSAERKVSTEAGEALARDHNMVFFETSAKINKNVDEAFLTIADQAAAVMGLTGGGAAAGTGGAGFKLDGGPASSGKKKCACA